MTEQTSLEIQRIAEGKLQSAFSKELQAIIEDIFDTDKDPTEDRTIDIKIKIKPKHDRSKFTIDASAKSKLGTRSAGYSHVRMEKDANGQVNLFEAIEED